MCLPSDAPPLTAASAAVFGRPALTDILRERVEQIDRHGFTLEHDLGHHPDQLARAGEAYLGAALALIRGRGTLSQVAPADWPFEREAWRPGDPRASLVKSIAILWALVDRIDGDPTDPPAGDGFDEQLLADFDRLHANTSEVAA